MIATAPPLARTLVTAPFGTTPTGHLRAEVLGRVRLWRGAAPVDDQPWRARERVRQLLSYLTMNPRAPRWAIAAALWPALDDDKAAANLRVTLNHLQGVLEPERCAGFPTTILRSEGDMLTLDLSRVRTDLGELEVGLDRARLLDGHGDAGGALHEYERALWLVRGRLLEDCDDRGWAEMERLRVAALVTAARCRLGELWLGRGEPERAAAVAGEILAAEPAQERAGRLLARAVAGQGDRTTSRRVLAELLDRLAELGLDPEPDTARIASAHGLAARLAA